MDFFLDTPVWFFVSRHFTLVFRSSLYGQLRSCLESWICCCCFLKLFQFFSLKLAGWLQGDGLAIQFQLQVSLDWCKWSPGVLWIGHQQWTFVFLGRTSLLGGSAATEAVNVEIWVVLKQSICRRLLLVACDQILLLFLFHIGTDETFYIQILLLELFFLYRFVHSLSDNQSGISLHMLQANYPEVVQLQVLIGIHLLRALQACSHHSCAVLAWSKNILHFIKSFFLLLLPVPFYVLLK